VKVRPKMKAEKESFSWASAAFAAPLLSILLIHSGKRDKCTFIFNDNDVGLDRKLMVYIVGCKLNKLQKFFLVLYSLFCARYVKDFNVIACVVMSRNQKITTI